MTDSSLIASMPDVFLEIDNKGLIARYLGGGTNDSVLSPAELVGKKVSDVWSVSAAKLMLRNVRRALTDRRELRFTVELTSGEETARYEVRLIVRGFNRVLAILRQDDGEEGATETTETEDHLTDTLTGLPRTSVFREQMGHMLADCRLRERGLAVVAMDIDGFSELERSLGRDVGDAVLRASAERIERYLRGSDSFTRLGNDAFVLVVADVDTREHADTIANRVDQSFSEPLSVCGHNVEVTPSCGIALYPVDGDDAETLLQNSRVALNEARLSGRNSREYYSSTMRFRTNQRLDDKAELQWAIEREQLSLRYQPRVSLDDGKVQAVEALIRWDHPIRGQLKPEYFLPLADASGLMPEIGRWTISQAVADAVAWRDSGVDLSVSINLTESEFSHAALVEHTRSALNDSGLGQNRLEFEITERMLMSHDRAYIVTHKLEDLGVRLLVDQYGEGASSAQRLIRFPVQAVKLSSEMLCNVTTNDQSQAVCSALIAMARELNWCVIAVGIETREQLDYLRARSCSAIQGHFISEPLAAADVVAYAEKLKAQPLDANLVPLRASDHG